MSRVILASQSVGENALNVTPVHPSLLWEHDKHCSPYMSENQHISFKCLKVYVNIISEEVNVIVRAVGLWDVVHIPNAIQNWLAVRDPHIPTPTWGDDDHSGGCYHGTWTSSTWRCSYRQLYY